MFKLPAARLADVARDVTGAWLIVASEGLEDLACIIRGLQAPPPRPSGMEPPAGWCGDCESVHPVDGEMPPELAALVFGRAAAASAPAATGDAPAPAWSPAFVAKVRKGDLIGLDLGGRETASRTFRVCDVWPHAEGDLGFGSAPGVTLLLQDVVSGTVITPSLPLHGGVRVAPSIPDVVPADLVGGSE